MTFREINPEHENSILIAFVFEGETVIKQGNYYFDCGGAYYDYDGEEIENVKGWAKYPVISFLK